MRASFLRQRRGFTLLELLLATVIFSIIIVNLYFGFYTAVLGYYKVNAASSAYRAIKLTLDRLEADLNNVFIYSRADSGFHGSVNAIDFFSEMDMAENEKKSINIVKIKYQLEGKVLKRAYQRNLDAIKGEGKVSENKLTSDIKEISFQYASLVYGQLDSYKWQDSWPQGEDSFQKTSLPVAVKVKLSLFKKDKRNSLAEVGFVRIMPICIAYPGVSGNDE